MVIYNLYWQRHCVPDSIHFRRHKQNSSNCVVTCGAVAEKGPTLWMDNFYNSPAMAQRLKTLKTDCVGTLRLSRKDVPQSVKEKKLKKGELVAQHSGPVSVLKWKDKKEVTMISTYHGQDTRMMLTKCRQEKQKPVSVLDYNENMGGVDLKDQFLQHYILE